jgi:hypothetical protein
VNAYVSAASYSPYGEANQYSLGVNVQVAWLTFSRDAQTRRVTTANLSAQTAIPQLENVDYSYDPAGNITRSVDAEGGGPNVPVETQCYSYDPLDQLTAAWSGTDNCATAPTSGNNAMVGGPQPYWTSWTLDAAGGRSGQTVHALPGAGGGDAVTTYTAGVSGHAHALAATTTSGPGAGSTSYGYDPAGDTTVRAGIPGGDQALVA